MRSALVIFTDGNRTKLNFLTRRDTRESYETKLDYVIRLAVEKVYGKNCFWWPDSGLGWRYGQVMRSLKPTKHNSTPGNTSVTNRISIDVVIDGCEQ